LTWELTPPPQYGGNIDVTRRTLNPVPSRE